MWGGVVYHNLGLKFLSPTINEFMSASDFVKFCSNLQFYLSQDLKEIMGCNCNYPVAKLDDITIFCVHYKSFEEFCEKWHDRKTRINWDKTYFILTERDGCTYNDIVEFDKLPYKNKVVFVKQPRPEIKSAFYINGVDCSITALTDYLGKFTGLRWLDKFDFVSFIDKGELKES